MRPYGVFFKIRNLSNLLNDIWPFIVAAAVVVVK